MALSDPQIIEQNPWWGDPTAIERDPYLVRLGAGRFRWDPPVLDAIDVRPGALHTLRGPRQVGKSTTVKRLVRRLLEAGERRILYFTLDLAADNEAIVEVLRRARQLHPNPEGPWYVFLDEVTTVPDWQRALKYAVDVGLIAGDFVLCTGSSARRMGTELMPGRRGDGRDYIQLPASFRDVCTQALRLSLPSATCTVGDLLDPARGPLLREVHLQAASLAGALRRYLAVGGFPTAVEDHLRGGVASETTVRILWAAVAGDLQQADRSSIGALKLLERVSRSLGSLLSWEALAEAMAAPNATTARDYVELLARSFMLLTMYFWDLADDTLNPQKQRKVYFADPLLEAIPALLMPGARRAPAAGMIENLVAIGLYRSATERLVQAEPFPGAVGVWRSGRGTEIDFVVPERAPGLTGARLPIEVKGDNRTAISNARKSIRHSFGRGIIATDTVFEPDAPIPAIPVPVLLALLRERPERVSESA